MDPERHAELAALALARGFVSVRTVAQVLLDVGRTSERGDAPETLWVGSGRLTQAQLESLQQTRGSADDESPRSTRHLERYVRVGVLGSGAMGEVTLCTDTRLGRRVAVKALRDPLTSSAVAVGMLEREARITGSLEHP